jgi:hypothetical protein
MSLISAHITEVEKQSDELLGSILTTAKEGLEAARESAAAGSNELARYQRALAHLEATETAARARLELARKLAPGSPRIANVSAAADAMTKQLSAAFDRSTMSSAEVGRPSSSRLVRHNRRSKSSGRLATTRPAG